jgi:hypothetical protein
MADLSSPHLAYSCPCVECRERPRGRVAQDHGAINRVLALLNERQRRFLAGLLAERRGHGGLVAVARITGLSRTTIRRGLVELRRGDDVPEGRIRRPGGGRPRAEKKIRRW